MSNIRHLALADAQFTGWIVAIKGDDNIITLVTEMGLTKEEWLKLKEEWISPTTLRDKDIEAINHHFGIAS